MSQRGEGDAQLPCQATGSPLLGVVATSANSNAVAGTILRGRSHNLDVVVISACVDDCESLEFARELDAHIVSREWGEPRTVQEKLVELGRDSGYPGVIFVDEAVSSPSISRSIESVRNTDAYLVEAVEGGAADAEGSTMIAIPAYNEAQSIEDVVNGARQHGDIVLVVDDGSDDGTGDKARNAGANVITHQRNRGYGAALRTIFERASEMRVERLVIVDGDGQHQPSDIPALLTCLRERDVDVAIGSRFKEQRNEIPLLRRMGLKSINSLTNLIMWPLSGHRWLSDTQSGFRAYNREATAVLATQDQIGDGMESSIDILFTCVRSGLEVSEVGTKIDYDVEEPNTYHPIAHGFALFRNTIRIIEREFPITFLGIPGAIALLVGIGFGYWTTLNYIQTLTFPVGISISAVFFTLIGIFTIFTAIILHALKEHSDRISDTTANSR